MLKTHTAQNIGRLRELNILIINNLDGIAPRIAEVKKRSFNLFDSGRLRSASSSFLIIDNETEMTAVVGGLLASLLQGYELVAKIDEGASFSFFAAELEFKETPIKGQCLDVSIPLPERYGSDL